MAATALSSFKTDDVASTIAKLSTEELDILLHYVFRSFDFVDQQKISANVLLTFHDEVSLHHSYLLNSISLFRYSKSLDMVEFYVFYVQSIASIHFKIIIIMILSLFFLLSFNIIYFHYFNYYKLLHD